MLRCHAGEFRMCVLRLWCGRVAARFTAGPGTPSRLPTARPAPKGDIHDIEGKDPERQPRRVLENGPRDGRAE